MEGPLCRRHHVPETSTALFTFIVQRPRRSDCFLPFTFSRLFSHFRPSADSKMTSASAAPSHRGTRNEKLQRAGSEAYTDWDESVGGSRHREDYIASLGNFDFNWPSVSPPEKLVAALLSSHWISRDVSREWPAFFHSSSSYRCKTVIAWKQRTRGLQRGLARTLGVIATKGFVIQCGAPRALGGMTEKRGAGWITKIECYCSAGYEAFLFRDSDAGRTAPRVITSARAREGLHFEENLQGRCFLYDEFRGTETGSVTSHVEFKTARY